MMVSNFSTESYDGKQLQATSVLKLMMTSNFRTESYDNKQLQYGIYDGKQLQY